ncbi:MAG: hypothetical protein ACLQVL_36825 [Terriglobia bacterium]
MPDAPSSDGMVVYRGQKMTVAQMRHTQQMERDKDRKLTQEQLHE